jgi:hypothetical protein
MQLKTLGKSVKKMGMCSNPKCVKSIRIGCGTQQHVVLHQVPQRNYCSHECQRLNVPFANSGARGLLI